MNTMSLIGTKKPKKEWWKRGLNPSTTTLGNYSIKCLKESKLKSTSHHAASRPAGRRDPHASAWARCAPAGPSPMGLLGDLGEGGICIGKSHSTDMDGDAPHMLTTGLEIHAKKKQCNIHVKYYYYFCYTGLLNLMRTPRDSINPNHSTSVSQHYLD